MTVRSAPTRVRGDDWTLVGTLSGDGSIAGATAAAQLRRSIDSPVIAEFTTAVTDGPGREVTLTLGRAVTALIAPGTYRFDIQVDLGGVRRTWGAGSVLVVAADVTR